MNTLKLIKRSRNLLCIILATVMTIIGIPSIPAFADENASTRSIDQMLLKSQEWLNDTYHGTTGFVEVPEDGTSRRSTVNGCIRALQIELGITATADNFGTGTITRFNQQYPNGVSQQSYPSSTENNIYGIIQCALWTKGYSTGANVISKHFYGGTGSALKAMKSDMGISSSSSTVTVDIMKALLSMNYYVTASNGDPKITQIQRELNATYHSYIGIIPCDGVYTRSMNKALIIALQAIEGYSVDDATGNFGAGTKNNLPLDLTNAWTQDLTRYHQCIKLLQYALYCNGYEDNIDLNNTEWNSNLSNAILQFQTDMNISATGLIDVDTWMALLLSKGNPDRACIACDTNKKISTAEQFSYLKNNGISIIGRYLSSSSKGITREEAKDLIGNGFSIFPIYQEIGIDEDITAFTANRGNQDAIYATSLAKSVGFKQKTIIYFAVDFDPTDYEISKYVLPYFKSLNQTIGNYYKIGVYGTRNVCTQVLNSGYAETCFVSDMSTGYSGNMGFKMPTNWNFDQFNEIQTGIYLSECNKYWNIDKVSYKGTFPVVKELGDSINEEARYNTTEGCFVLDSSYPVNTGIPRFYNGRKLKVSITITGENGEAINDGTKVSITLDKTSSKGNDDPITTPLPIPLFDAIPDGRTYTLADFGNQNSDYIIIDSSTRYYLKYALQSGYTSNVKIRVKVESFDY